MMELWKFWTESLVLPRLERQFLASQTTMTSFIRAVHGHKSSLLQEETVEWVMFSTRNKTILSWPTVLPTKTKFSCHAFIPSHHKELQIASVKTLLPQQEKQWGP